MGGFIYQNDTLQFVSHEEGRARWALHRYVNGSSKYGWEYDFFLKDHLGNTRMVLTQEKDTAQYIATMEAAYRATENRLFYNIPATSYARSAVSGYPTDNTTVPNDSLARVNGNGPKTGPSILLRVMSGDVVDVATKSFYKSGGTVQSPNSTLTDILNSIAGGIVTATSASHGVVSDLTNISTSPIYAALNSFLPTNDPNTTGKPKAYLNWILLDDQFKGVNTYPQSGAMVVGSADVLNTLAYSGIPITKNGYLYIWVSNETPGWDVFFDNVSVKQYSGPITEETHYYPFGLTMAGISSKAALGLENKYKYNGKELQHQEFSDGSGLEEYDYGARMQDPQLGMWHNIDPLAGKFFSNSPYNYAIGNPISIIDLLGMEAEDSKDDGDEMVRVKYTLNKKTGVVSQEQVSEGEYQANTGSDENQYSGDLTKDEALGLAKITYDDNKYNTGKNWGNFKVSHAADNISGFKLEDQNTGFKSRLFERSENGKTEYAYAFTGTQFTSLRDWYNNAGQLLGISKQYDQAISNAKLLARELGPESITYVGHSLGGGLAIAAALATGSNAITFNSAWLSQATIGRYSLNTTNGNSQVNNYIISGDPLDVSQRALQYNLGLTHVGTDHYQFSFYSLFAVGIPLCHSIDRF
jgi:RHS repeat-associated protein